MITFSKLDRIAACPASETLPHADEVTEWASEGTAAHAYVEAIASGVPREQALAQVPEEHRDLCASIDVDLVPRGVATEVAYAIDLVDGTARELGRGLRRGYVDLRQGEICGTLDVVGRIGDAVYVADWKFGHREVSADSLQLIAGAVAAALAYGADRATVQIIRGTGGKVRFLPPLELDAIDIENELDRLRRIRAAVLRAQLAARKGESPRLRTGDHCRYCPAFRGCPAQQTLALAVLRGEIVGPAEDTTLAPAQIGEVFARLMEAERVVKKIKSACYAAAARESIPLPDGRVLEAREVESKEALDGDVVWQVLTEQRGREVADAAVSRFASKAGLKRALLPVLGDETLAAAEREVLGEVRRRGGASRTTSRKVGVYAADGGDQ